MLMLVDAPGLWYRSFHALPSSMRAPDGTQVNAVRGFCDGLATLIRQHSPTGLVCAVDVDWRPAWRVELLPSYKAHRVAADGTEAEPDELGHQVDTIVDLLAALGIPTAGAADYEADDVLATLARRADEPVSVVTGDRDLFQLVDDSKPVRVVYIGRGIAKADTYDVTAVRDRFGVEPGQYADFAVLRGDPSDGLPGVKGVGDKTAARLITRYGNLERLLEATTDPRAEGLTPRVRTALIDSRVYAEAAITVVRTVDDAPVPTVNGTIPPTPADPGKVDWFGDRYGLGGSLTRLREALWPNGS